jgi:DNA-binding response OmpR family regulator
MRVLVVDDNVMVGRMVQRVLRDEHEVVVVESVAEARQALGKDPFDFVVSDVMMPVETGADLHRWLVDKQPEMKNKLLFMTGGIPDAKVSAYVQASDVDCLMKPFEPSHLTDYLRTQN